ncbi:VOC family protein [Kitasatospora hibisci]|uniref:VOC family protein n=1 Tax=Kitasatospora hibisci TaxID=3369522 RepID=UPI003753EAE6
MLTTAVTPGSPNWLDLTSPDTADSATFYATVLGWTFAATDPEDGGHGLFQQHGRTVAALGPIGSDDGDPAWTISFCSLDVDRTAELVETAGGLVHTTASDAAATAAAAAAPLATLAGARTIHCTDTTGARFAVRQPGRTPGLEAVTEPGTFCWAECYSVDAEAAKAFYRAVFSWQEQDVPFGEEMYTVLTPAGGGTDDAHGGLMQLSPAHTAAGTGSHWLPYFEVPNVDAAVALAERLHATVRTGPTDVHGVGRLAQLADPYGAVFAVITSAASSG